MNSSGNKSDDGLAERTASTSQASRLSRLSPKPSAIVEGLLSAFLTAVLGASGSFLIRHFLTAKDSELSMPFWVYLPYPVTVFLLMATLAGIFVWRRANLGTVQAGKQRILRAAFAGLLVLVVPMLLVAGYVYWTQPLVSNVEPCFISREAEAWHNIALLVPNLFQAPPRRFNIEFDAIPNGAVDEAFGVSKGPQTTWQNFSCMVRFHQDRHIQIWNGIDGDDINGRYETAHSVPYSPNIRYRFLISADTTTHTCLAYVSTSAGEVKFLGTSNFRAVAESLDNFGTFMDVLPTSPAENQSDLAVKVCNVKYLPF
jgi:hypothetical protein